MYAAYLNNANRLSCGYVRNILSEMDTKEENGCYLALSILWSSRERKGSTKDNINKE